MEKLNENDEAYSASLHIESLTCDCAECQGKRKYVQIIDVDRYIETLNEWD